MILTGQAIANAVKSGDITIDPFVPGQVNPNSYNFTLGPSFRVYKEGVLNPREKNQTDEIWMKDGEIVLQPRRLYLAHTRERIGSKKFAPTYAARSSVARLGMFINLSASLGDIGFIGQWTIQLFALHPIRLYEGMAIGQMMFWQPKGEIELYEGKYQGAYGPIASRIHRDVAVEPVDTENALMVGE
ncbi:dCTP deaminase [Roseobacter weihaiensis]|uniref:dCTP deaminase n=1 Tax=Roseobacter weihaiensis TaxID=2763262 RepID=UPI001D0A4A48|nr:dCTP deaminase [Roseobacter sp. H9]